MLAEAVCIFGMLCAGVIIGLPLLGFVRLWHWRREREFRRVRKTDPAWRSIEIGRIPL